MLNILTNNTVCIAASSRTQNLFLNIVSFFFILDKYEFITARALWYLLYSHLHFQLTLYNTFYAAILLLGLMTDGDYYNYKSSKRCHVHSFTDHEVNHELYWAVQLRKEVVDDSL